MDHRINKETAVCTKRVLDTEITQAVEHDFILPDYCPDIFRVLKCFVVPGVVSTSINGSRLSFELSVTMRVMYRSGSGGIACIEHTCEYTKSADLPADADGPAVIVTPYVQNVNCRASDKRRVDVRAGVVCRVCVDAEDKRSLVIGARGGGIQLKKEQALFPTARIVAAKRITVIEELELAAGKPAFGSVLRCGTAVALGESRIMSGKLVTKGEAEISLVYLPKGVDEPPESMRFSIPFSQILDVDGLTDDLDTDVTVNAARCVITPREENGLLECELILTVNITAMRCTEGELVTDAYSTRCECELDRMAEPITLPPEKLRVGSTAEAVLSSPEGEISRVYDLWTDGAAASVISADEGSEVSGRVTFCMLAVLADGTPCYIEKECTFKADTQAAAGSRVTVSSQSSSYTLSENGSVKCKTDLELSVSRAPSEEARYITDIRLLIDSPKMNDSGCAVKICFSDSNESVWDIAKRYSTEPQAIEEQNPAAEGSARRALIIPIKN